MAKRNKIALTEYVRHRLNVRLEGTRDQSELARQLGLTPQWLSMLRSKPGTIVGADSEEPFAKWIADDDNRRDPSLRKTGTVDELRSDANTWFSAQHPEIAKNGERGASGRERYPNRPLAAEFARKSRISEPAIGRVLGYHLNSETDPTPEEWFEMMKWEANRIRVEAMMTPADHARQAAEDRARFAQLKNEYEKGTDTKAHRATQPPTLPRKKR